MRLPDLPLCLSTECDGQEGSTDAEAGVPLTGVSGAICVQKLDDSRNSAIHIKYRISLRSSSLWEPRYPLLRVVLVGMERFSFEGLPKQLQLDLSLVRKKGFGRP